MPDKLLAEFPETTFEQWREQVEKDLKGADFQKRLVTRTVEGLTVQPLYTARDVTGADSSLAAHRRGAAPAGRYGAEWDLRSEHSVWDIDRARDEITAELSRGASSLWLRFDTSVRTGSKPAEKPDGLAFTGLTDLEALLSGVDLARIPVVLDAGGSGPAVAAAYLALAAKRGIATEQLRGGFGCDPLGAAAQDGRLAYDLETAKALALELIGLAERRAPKVRSLVVNTTPYHDAGATGAQEIAIALGTALTYLRWAIEAGLPVGRASAQLEFRVGIAGDLFAELAKLRALRLGYAKLIAALGGDDAAQTTQLHAVTARRTKTLRDPWVNMLRTTTEAFSAMAGGADSLTTRGFDEVLGPSDSFARRIARNVQIILNEEAHVTHVADPAGGSYYVEAMTDGLARDGWKQFQQLEAAGGIAASLQAGKLQAQIADLAAKRESAIGKRAQAITGVSEFANIAEEALVRPTPTPSSAKPGGPSAPDAAAVAAAKPGTRLEAAIGAFGQGVQLQQVVAALAAGTKAFAVEALPVRRHAARFEALRARAEAHAAQSGKVPSAFLANLGPIPKHKARAAFTSGFMNAGGIAVLDNDGFKTAEEVAKAFAESGTKLAVICGSDDQYPEWVLNLAPLLAKAGAVEIFVAGRPPADQEAAWKSAGVTGFIFMGADVAAVLASLLDRLGVAP
ncbi:MAG TPA: methylmalonyl-CoA mutase family protein [Polyangiales bacterium]|nr:methylmalonyl-CoA mutase family protein [Polyangiales bacterium]